LSGPEILEVRNYLPQYTGKEGQYKFRVSTIDFQLKKCTWWSLVPAIQIRSDIELANM
jgi:hypothetical protein